MQGAFIRSNKDRANTAQGFKRINNSRNMYSAAATHTVVQGTRHKSVKSTEFYTATNFAIKINQQIF